MSLLAALSTGGEEKLYVDDVFSAYTYTGNGSTQTINNGIDLAGKGGLVWIKNRGRAVDNGLYDTARGALKGLQTNLTVSQQSFSNTLTGFNSTGFSLGADGSNTVNLSNDNYVSWTFRKAAKFFDIVTYTGDGTANRQIAHNLGCDVGMVITKITSTTGNWNTYHRSATGDLVLNTTAAQTGSHAIVTAADASTFTVTGVANTNGATYVAYLFAHDTSTDGIIQCGSFTGNTTVNLGFEPQYILAKNAGGGGSDWFIFDTSRGLTMSGENWLFANGSTSESSSSTFYIKPTSTGFETGNSFFGSGSVIYLAIRRPNKPPTTGTQVYNAIARTGTGAAATVTGVGFAPDLVHSQARNSAVYGGAFFDRLRGNGISSGTYYTGTEISDTTSISSYEMDGIKVGSDGTGWVNINSTNYINHFFKRAVGVFDEVCDTGTGSSHTITHNLGVAPELIIRKGRSGATQWEVYCSQLANAEKLVLNSTAAKATDTTAWNSTTPTSSVFTVGTGANVNTNTATYVSYLFASKSGISKVGSYTGNGSSQTIDCGFSTGARFILIKRTDSTGDWYVWDSTRGIIAGNDPHLSLNTTAAEVTTDDSIDPNSTGFIVNQLAATNINVNAATYIYLAFA